MGGTCLRCPPQRTQRPDCALLHRALPRLGTAINDPDRRTDNQSGSPAASMTFFKPLPRSITRPVSALLVVAWVGSMAVLVKRSYIDAPAANLATDLARYGSNAEWRGVYYRGEKIGFTVSQTVPTDDGFELQEDGRLQMSLLGATTAAALHTSARVDPDFALRTFDFS